MKKSIAIPFDFVLEQLESCRPVIRPMFGCHAIYVSGKLVLMLRRKETNKLDNGVWVAIVLEHHCTLKKIFPSMRSIRMFGDKASAWQNLPATADDFEESVVAVCEMIRKNDPRIGKIPRPKKKKTIRKR